MKNFILFLSLLAISSSAMAYELGDLSGKYQGRHKIWGKCYLEIKENQNYGNEVTIDIEKKSGSRFSGLRTTTESMIRRLSENPTVLHFSVETFRASAATCALMWWAGGCKNDYFGYTIDLNKDGSAKNVVYTRRGKKKIRCRHLKRI